MTMEPIIRFRGFSYAYPEAGDYTLRDIDLDIGAGECHCISGPTGSGKTTLALAFKGLLPPGKQTGTVISPENSLGSGPSGGLVLQNPETQILRSTVGAEAAFGLENLCVDPRLMPGMAAEAVSALGLDKPLSFRTDALSMGQKYRLIVASLLVMHPHVLILDEPAGQLDPDGIGMLADIILVLKGRGVSILLCENRPESFAGVIDYIWLLGEGGTLRLDRDCPGNREDLTSNRLQITAMKKVPKEDNDVIVS
ncbi:ABC transporter ATP-binding protein, partial [archaeon]|nr:ABC transporter ATP-binding protein [archaeon]